MAAPIHAGTAGADRGAGRGWLAMIILLCLADARRRPAKLCLRVVGSADRKHDGALDNTRVPAAASLRLNFNWGDSYRVTVSPFLRGHNAPLRRLSADLLYWPVY